VCVRVPSQVGELIDSTIGVTFGLSTLTAAGFGQIFSDTSGVCLRGCMCCVCLLCVDVCVCVCVGVGGELYICDMRGVIYTTLNNTLHPGVAFGGLVEATVAKLGLKPSGLTPEQRVLPRVRFLSTLSAAIGMCV
jgi:hypothetical protein